MVRAFVSHQCGLGLILAQYHLWVEFVAGSLLALSVFCWVLQFSSPAPQKPTSPNSNQTRIDFWDENHLTKPDMASKIL